MPESPEATKPPPNRQTTLLIALLGLALAAVGWFAYQNLSGAPAAAEADATPAPWPTLPATVTPLPSAPPATPVPTPTPLPTPFVEQIAELATLAHTFEVVQEATPEPNTSLWKKIWQLAPGEDRVILATTWKARYGVRLDDAGALQFDRDEQSITLTIPPVEVLSVEQIGETRLLLLSKQVGHTETAELTIAAQNRAQVEARERAQANQEMIGVAEDLTRLRLIEHLRALGYTSVEVTFRPSRGTP